LNYREPAKANRFGTIQRVKELSREPLRFLAEEYREKEVRLNITRGMNPMQIQALFTA
jgi:hypothetical protein